MISIYLTDLAAYNNGILLGEWLDLNEHTLETLEAKKEEILKQGTQACKSETQHEEFFITDYDIDPFFKNNFGEYESLESLLELNDFLESINDSEVFMIYCDYHSLDLDQFETNYDEFQDNFIMTIDCDGTQEAINEAYGSYVAEEAGMLSDSDSDLVRYFNAERYGHDLLINLNSIYTNKTWYIFH